MNKIVFIAPNQEIFDMGQRILSELDLMNKTSCYLGWMKKGVEIARHAVADGAMVIISRGGTAELISKTGIQIPVVELSISFQDLAETLLKAKKISAKENPKIAVLAFKNMIKNIDVFARVMNLNLKIYVLNSEEEIEVVLNQVLQGDYDVIIGGILTTNRAAAKGVKTVLLTSGEDSYRDAILEAERVIYARALEKERMKIFRVSVDYSNQGIVSIDSEMRISIYNNAAERLLGIDANQAIGKSIHSILPSLPLKEMSDGRQTRLGELIQINGKRLIANIIPIDVDDDVSGIMLTLEDVGNIVEIEANVRQKLYNKGLCAHYRFEDIIGASPLLVEAKMTALQYAETDATVVVFGATGTGKELFAQSIHNASKRCRRPFVALNCGAIPSTLLESELFGYVEGAFTGATKKGKPGLFELAHGGTIFLDEIGEMDKLAQTSLLRIIQERRVMRLGGDKYIPIDVRIIAASNKNLLNLVKEGKLREDLYYRIHVLPLELPELKDCPGDSLLIASRFLSVYNEMFNKSQVLSEKVKAFIESYEWSGNVRELRNYIERLVVTAKEIVIPLSIESRTVETGEIKASMLTGKILRATDEKAEILKMLEKTRYNIKKAAKGLGISRSTLYRKMKAQHIELRVISSAPM